MMNAVPFSIRPAELKDVPSLQENCWPHRTREDVEIRLGLFLGRPQPAAAKAVVAVLTNGAVVGYAQLSMAGRRMEIANVIVAEAYRTQGIGSGLITHLLEHASLHNITAVEIGVAESNEGALRLYRRLGFVEFRKVALNVGNGKEPIIYLKKHLTLPVV